MVYKGCGAILLDKDCILLLKYRNKGMPYWAEPYGPIAKEELANEAIERILNEMLGVDIGVIKPLCDYEKKRNSLERIIAGYFARIVFGDPVIKKKELVMEIAYFPNFELPNNVAPQTVQFVNQLIKEDIIKKRK